MKPLKLFLIALILTIGVMELAASGTVAIYAIVERVALEPGDSAPERVQIWGVFTLADGGANSAVTLTPQRGYLYFALPSGLSTQHPDVRRAWAEWADFKAVAGTGQAIAFGRVGYIGAFADELISRPPGMPPHLLGAKLRSESLAPTNPNTYLTDFGLTKIPSTGNLAPVVEKLKAALKR